VFCINCGNELPDVAKFCGGCGAPVNGAQPSTRPSGGALDNAPPSEPTLERCKTVVKLVKHGHVMAQKSRIVAEGWGPGGPYIVDGSAPEIYYTPDSYRQARYGDQWSKAVHALFDRLTAAGWVHEREAASGKWWEQVFVRPVTAASERPTSAPVDASWRPDPTTRHELRYFDGTTWTSHVADGGVQAVDPYDANEQ
jgi:hypothetical protein